MSTTNFKPFEKFEDAINSLNIIEPKPTPNYDYGENAWDEAEYKSDYDSIMESLEKYEKLKKAFIEVFNQNDILLQKYFYEKNDDFFKLAQSIKNTEYNNGTPYPRTYFSQSNAEDNNNLHNFIYVAIRNIEKFIEFTKTQDKDGNYYLTLIEIYALPEVLKEYYPEIFNEK